MTDVLAELAPAVGVEPTLGGQRNALAIAAFSCWVASIVLFFGAILVGWILALEIARSNPDSAFLIIACPIMVAPLCAILSLVGLLLGVAALRRKRKTLAVVAIVLNAVSLSIPLLILTSSFLHL